MNGSDPQLLRFLVKCEGKVKEYRAVTTVYPFFPRPPYPATFRFLFPWRVLLGFIFRLQCLLFPPFPAITAVSQCPFVSSIPCYRQLLHESIPNLALRAHFHAKELAHSLLTPMRCSMCARTNRSSYTPTLCTVNFRFPAPHVEVHSSVRRWPYSLPLWPK